MLAPLLKCVCLAFSVKFLVKILLPKFLTTFIFFTYLLACNSFRVAIQFISCESLNFATVFNEFHPPVLLQRFVSQLHVGTLLSTLDIRGIYSGQPAKSFPPPSKNSFQFLRTFIKSSFKFFPVFQFIQNCSPPRGGGMARIYAPEYRYSIGKLICFSIHCEQSPMDTDPSNIDRAPHHNDFTINH